MKIPNGYRADLGTKLEECSLNLFHRQGQHKARVFDSVLGITAGSADELKGALRHAAAESEDAVHKSDNGYGDLSELRFSVTTSKATATVLSAWIIRRGEDVPRLTPCFML